MMKKHFTLLIKSLLILSIALISVSCTEKVFYLLGEEEITLDVHSAYTEPGVYSKDEVPVSINSTLDVDKLGDYTITYTATFNKKEKSLTRVVHVVDTTAPQITLNGSVNTSLCPNHDYQEEGFTALDNYDGDLSPLVQITQISNGLKYSVLDSSSNLAEITRLFTIEDTQSPEIKLIGYDHIMLHQTAEYYEFGASATDNCDDVSENIVVTHNINSAVLGTYTVTYTVTDQAGNISSITREVEVTDKIQTVVYLTFDDGPSYRTLEVLDILKEYGVKATFFVGKKTAEYEPIMLRAYQEGHTVALHAYSHTATTIYSSTVEFFKNLYLVQDWVESVTGVKSYIYRFPGGSSNMSSSFNPGIMTTLTQMVLDEGFHYFDWNISSGDGSSKTTTAQMIYNVTINCKPGRNNIVLMHDSASHDESVAALRPILDYLKSIDAVILPITMETPQIHHQVNN
jgi:peptidoglycan/xylan/chitin deacetylase (PgdA/CDA1 family)